MRVRSLLLVAVLAACSSNASPKAKPDPAPPVVELPPIPTADEREPLLARTVVTALSTRHLRKRAIDDALSREVFDAYIEELDPSKLFLLQSDVTKLARHRDDLDDQLQSGRFALAHEGGALLAARRDAFAAYVAKRLTEPFDYTVEESWDTDLEGRALVATEAELQERWRLLLKLQVLERAGRMDDKTPFAEREAKAREELATSYASRFTRIAQGDPLEPAELFVNSVAHVYDPHTLWMPPADRDNFDIAMSGQLDGIGALLLEDAHYIRVTEIVPGGAASRDGRLQAGDLIMAVAQDGEAPVDVTDMRLTEVVQMIRGPRGTVVTLTVKKPDESVVKIAITRDKVEVEASYAKAAILEVDGRRLGYIELPLFYGDTRHTKDAAGGRNAAADVRALLVKLRDAKVDGVVLDLRGNTGGLLDLAAEITGLFIPTGPVVQTRASIGRNEVYGDNDPEIVYDGPVVVLIDQFSASASEIVASALQDYRRAVIVGTSASHGKGTVQALIDLNALHEGAPAALGVLKLTIQQFYGVDGDSTQWRGVVPDILLPAIDAHADAGERSLDNALPWAEVEPLPFELWPGGRGDVLVLGGRSQERVRASAVFKKIAARADYLKLVRERTLVSLHLPTWLAQRAADEKALEAVALDLDEGKPLLAMTPLDTSDDKAERDRIDRWKRGRSRDPWLAEAAHICVDLAGPATGR